MIYLVTAERHVDGKIVGFAGYAVEASDETMAMDIVADQLPTGCVVVNAHLAPEELIPYLTTLALKRTIH